MKAFKKLALKRSFLVAAFVSVFATAAYAANWVGECNHPTHRYHSGATNSYEQAQNWVGTHNQQFPDHAAYTGVREW